MAGCPSRNLECANAQMMGPSRVQDVLAVLNEHYRAFFAAKPFADQTGHTVPSDTKSFSEILVSLLTGVPGRDRKKGTDLADGSDVKAANVWGAIDTPRFNGCAPAGRTTNTARKPNNVTALDDIPFLFFVLWDERGEKAIPRCRVWCVRPESDAEFRNLVATWYEMRASGSIRSTNFQLHPPRNQDHNVIRNSLGNLEYPLFFHAERDANKYHLIELDEAALWKGRCRRVD